MKKVCTLACIAIIISFTSLLAAWEEFAKVPITQCTSSQIIDSTLFLYNGSNSPKQVKLNLLNQSTIESPVNALYVSTNVVDNESYRSGFNISSYCGIVEKSSDGGNTWSPLFIAPNNFLCFKTSFSESQRISVVGYNVAKNTAFISYSDSNNAFLTKSFTEYHKFLSIAESDGSYYIGTDNGMILKSDRTLADVAVSANVSEKPIKNMISLNGELFAFSDCGIVARKPKNSDLWNSTSLVNDDSFIFNNTLILNDSVILVCGKSETEGKGMVLSSRDTGRTWRTVLTASENLTSLNLYKNSLILAVGGNGTVYKESIDFLGVEDNLLLASENIESVIVPDSRIYSLLLSDLQESCDLELFDLKGESIFKQFLLPKNNILNITFPESVPSGIYLIRISNSKFSKTIKALLN